MLCGGLADKLNPSLCFSALLQLLVNLLDRGCDPQAAPPPPPPPSPPPPPFAADWLFEWPHHLPFSALLQLLENLLQRVSDPQAALGAVIQTFSIISLPSCLPAVLQLLVNLLDRGCDPQAALDSPRFCVDMLDSSVGPASVKDSYVLLVGGAGEGWGWFGCSLPG